MIPRPRALLIDGTACLYRAYFAIRSLIGRDGSQVNAVYGLMREVLALLDEWRPEYAATAFDIPGEPTFRHRLFADYKRGRPPMPERLAPQIETAKTASQALGVPPLALAGWEADDLLATLVRFFKGRQVACLIVGADKDLAQLVGPGVWLDLPGQAIPMDAKAVCERYGVPPDRIPDLLALRGDEADSIPGVPGIGHRTAIRLLSAPAGLSAHTGDEAGLDCPDYGKTSESAQALRAGREVLYRNRELTRLRNDAPLRLTEGSLAYRGVDTEAMHSIGERFGFDRLRERASAFAAAWESERAIIEGR